MKDSFTFVLSMQIPSGKNAVQITRTGKRYPGKRFQVWREAALVAVRNFMPRKVTFDGPVEMVVDYVPGDRIRRDAPGLLDALCHLLEKSGLIFDDAQVKTVKWKELPVQKKCPRCVVTISALEDVQV